MAALDAVFQTCLKAAQKFEFEQHIAIQLLAGNMFNGEIQYSV